MIDQKQLISDDALDQHSDLNHTSSSPSSSSSSSVDHVKTESNFGRSAVKLFSLGARHRASANLSDTKVGEAEPNAINVVAVLNPSEQLQLNTFNGTHQQHSQADGIACGKDGKAAANRGQSFSSDWQSHCHKPTMAGSNNEQDAKQRSANRRLLITTMLCAFFMVVELVGGYLANSLSIMTDAAHLFSDIASFALSLLAVHLSSRRSNRKFTFGYQRAEILGAVCSILLIWMLTAVVVWLAIQRLLTMDFEIESTVMMAVSLFGVAVNILMGTG